MALASDSPLKFGWVEDGRLVERSGNTFIVEFPPSLQPQSQTLFWPQAVKKIEEQLAALLGERILFEARFTGVEPPPLEPEPPRAAAPSPAAPKPAAPKPASSSTTAPPAAKSEPAPQQAISPEELEAFKNDPLIKKALEVFQAEILVSPPTTGAS
jgi:hypothetical protein